MSTAASERVGARTRRNCYVVLLILLVSLVIFLAVPFGPGDTAQGVNVSGNVGGQHWTLAMSPIVVTANANVPTSLHIDAGVEVRFNAGTELNVSGAIYMNGTQANPITMTGNDAFAWAGYYRGLTIYNSWSGCIKNVTINYAQYALYGWQMYDYTVENLTINETGHTDIFLYQGMMNRFRYVESTWSPWGLREEGVWNNTFKNCKFDHHYNYGVYLEGFTTSNHFRFCSVSYNFNGIHTGYDTNNIWRYNWISNENDDIYDGSMAGSNYMYNYWSQYTGQDMAGDGFGDTSYSDGIVTDTAPMCPIYNDHDSYRFARFDTTVTHLGANGANIFAPSGVYMGGAQLQAGHVVVGVDTNDKPDVIAPAPVFTLVGDGAGLRDVNVICNWSLIGTVDVRANSCSIIDTNITAGAWGITTAGPINGLQVSRVYIDCSSGVWLNQVTNAEVDRITFNGWLNPMVLVIGSDIVNIHNITTDSSLTLATRAEGMTCVRLIDSSNIQLTDLYFDNVTAGLNIQNSDLITIDRVVCKDLETGIIGVGIDTLNIYNYESHDLTYGNRLNDTVNGLMVNCIMRTMPWGLFMNYSTDFQMDDCRFEVCDVGLHVDRSRDLTVQWCVFTGNRLGIELNDTDSGLHPTFLRNSFTFNTEYGAYNKVGNPVYSVPMNYWGTPTPTVSDTPPSDMTERFLLDPFLDESPTDPTPTDRLVAFLMFPLNAEDFNAPPTFFQWSPAGGYGVANQSFKLFHETLASTPILEVVNVSGNTYSPYAAFEMPDGLFYWRVDTLDINGGDHPSAAWSFTVDSHIDAVNLTSPAPAAIITNLQPLFEWDPIVDASTINYNFTLAEDDTMATVVFETDTTELQLACPVVLDNFKTYFWQIRSEDSYGNDNWSAIFNFTTNIPEPDSNTVEEDLGNGTSGRIDYGYTKTIDSGFIQVFEDPMVGSVLGKTALTPVVNFTVNGSLLVTYTNVTLYYPAGEDSGMDPDSIVLYWYASATGDWVEVTDFGVDTGANLVWGNVSQLGLFSVWGNHYPSIDAMLFHPVNVTTDTEVDFEASNSYDPDDDLDDNRMIDGSEVNTLSYDWDFGDGNGSTFADTDHTYTMTGTYNVTCTITDQLGLTDTFETQVDVELAEIPYIPPVRSVSIYGLADGTAVNKTTEVNVFTDNDEDIDYVLYFVDGEEVHNATEYPYVYDWNVKDFSRGNHTLSVTVHYVDGSTATNAVTVPIQYKVDPKPPEELARATAMSGGVVIGISFVLVDKLRQFLMGLGAEYAEEQLKDKTAKAQDLKEEKRSIITRKEILAMGVAILGLALAYAYSEMMGGLSSKAFRILNVPIIFMPAFDPTKFFLALPAALLTGVVVILSIELMEEYASRKQGIWSELRIWWVGVICLLISAGLFLVPFGYPAKSTPKADVPITIKKKGFVSAAVTLIVMSLTLPFGIMVTLSYIDVLGVLADSFGLVGAVGLSVTLMMLCYTVVPVKPLEGRDVFKWSKVLWISLFMIAILLFLFWAIWGIWPWIYIISGSGAIMGLIGMFVLEGTGWFKDPDEKEFDAAMKEREEAIQAAKDAEPIEEDPGPPPDEEAPGEVPEETVDAPEEEGEAEAVEEGDVEEIPEPPTDIEEDAPPPDDELDDIDDVPEMEGGEDLWDVDPIESDDSSDLSG